MPNDSEFTPHPASLPAGSGADSHTGGNASGLPDGKPGERGEPNFDSESESGGSAPAESVSDEQNPAKSAPAEPAPPPQHLPLTGSLGKPEENSSSEGSDSRENWVRATLDLAPIVFPSRSTFEPSRSGSPPPPLTSPPAAFEPLTPPAPQPRNIPNLGHTFLLLILAAVTLFAVEIVIFSSAMAFHLFGHESSQQLLREPRLLIPCMAISYLIIVALAWPFFGGLWHEPFPRGVRWNAGIVRRRAYLFLGIGVGLSVCVQLLSNFLPIPKTLPIDDFFRTPVDLWLVATFGTFLAPACEELAFRGFLLPSLASAWDWMAGGRSQRGTGSLGRDLSHWARVMQPRRPARGTEGFVSTPAQAALPDPKWSMNALIFSSILTSIGFALLHADQLAHSLVPLAVLFVVSLILCAVRLKFHSLAASALVHAAYNGTIFALIFYATDGFRHLDKLTR